MRSRRSEIIEVVREEMLPMEKNYWRTGPGMNALAEALRGRVVERDAQARMGRQGQPQDDRA